MPLDGLAVAALAAALHHRWSGARVNRVLQPNETDIALLIRNRGENATLLCSAHPTWPRVCVAPGIPPGGEHPPAFCMLLRKYLESARLVAVRQPNWERAIGLLFESAAPGERGYVELIVELLPRRANIVLVRNDRVRGASAANAVVTEAVTSSSNTEGAIVIDALQRRADRDDRRLPGEVYPGLPPQEKISPDAPPSKLEPVLRLVTDDRPLALHMASYIAGLSPDGARALLAATGVPSDWCGPLDPPLARGVAERLANTAKASKEGRITPSLLVEPPDGAVVDFWVLPLPLREPGQEHRACGDMEEAVRRASEHQLQIETVSVLRRRIERILREQTRRVRRKLERRREDWRQASRADWYKRCGDLLTASLHELNGRRAIADRTASHTVTLPDWFAEPDAEGRWPQVEIPIDPSLSPADNAQRYYRQYRKYKEAQEHIEAHLRETEAELAYLEQVGESLAWCRDAADLEEVLAELAAGGYVQENRPAQASRQARKASPGNNPYRFVLPGGGEIRVGRNNRQNDELTMGWARPDDLWFHVKDLPGAHVVLRPAPGQHPHDVPEEHIRLAAVLAAWFSRARQSSNVAVDCALRRRVRKPKGARPGMVLYEPERTLWVTPDQNLIRRLLADAG